MQQNLKNSNFPTKMHHILSKSKYNDIIRWDQSRTVIELVDQYKLQTIILPKYFRHNRIQSFFRQLNLYGFQKNKMNGIDYFSNQLLKEGKTIKELKSRNQIMRQKFNQDLVVRSSADRVIDQRQTEVQKKEKQSENTSSLANKASQPLTVSGPQIYPFLNNNSVFNPFYNQFAYQYAFNGLPFFNNLN